MSGPFDALIASLVRLHANGHPCGLDPRKAEGLARDLATGLPLERATTRAGLDPSLARSLDLASVSDVPAAFADLLTTAGTAATHRRTLRNAASYPLVLSLCIALTAGIIMGAVGPALAQLPLGATPSPGTGLVAAFVIGCGSLALLSIVVLRRLRAPLLSRGWVRIAGYAYLDSLRVLVWHGAALPAALRGAACLCDGPERTRGEALARALEADAEPPDTAPLLDDFEAAMLVSSARAGTLDEALAALAEHRQRALEREVPAQATRIHVASLILAGVSLALVGGTFFTIYFQALVG